MQNVGEHHSLTPRNALLLDKLQFLAVGFFYYLVLMYLHNTSYVAARDCVEGKLTMYVFQLCGMLYTSA